MMMTIPVQDIAYYAMTNSLSLKPEWLYPHELNDVGTALEPIGTRGALRADTLPVSAYTAGDTTYEERPLPALPVGSLPARASKQFSPASMQAQQNYAPESGPMFMSRAGTSSNGVPMAPTKIQSLSQRRKNDLNESAGDFIQDQGVQLAPGAAEFIQAIGKTVPAGVIAKKTVAKAREIKTATHTEVILSSPPSKRTDIRDEQAREHILAKPPTAKTAPGLLGANAGLGLKKNLVPTAFPPSM